MQKSYVFGRVALLDCAAHVFALGPLVDPPGAAVRIAMSRRVASPERYERYDPWASPSPVGAGDRNRLNPYNGFHGDRDEFREVLVGVFRDAGLLDAKAFRLDEDRASRFFDRVFDSYNAVPYHCALHAQEVTVAAHVLSRELRACGHGPFDEIETLALYVAALGHDVGHFGRTNAYLANSGHALHRLYPTSTMERFHVDLMSKVLAHPDDGLAPCVPESRGARAKFLALVERIILATDMAKHKIIVSDFEVLVGDRARRVRSTRGGVEASTSGASDDGFIAPTRLDDDERELALRATMKCADLSSLFLSLPRANFWGYRIMMESLQQGEREQREGLPRTSPSCQRAALANYFNHQAGFLEHVALPMFETFSVFTTRHFRAATLGIAETNLRAWRRGHDESTTECERRRRLRDATRAMQKVAAGCAMTVIFLASRRKVLLRNVEEHGGRDANLARDLENIRNTYQIMSAVYAVIGVAAAYGSTVVGESFLPVWAGEAFVRVVVPVLIAARFPIASSRQRVMRAAQMANNTGLRGEALNLQRRDAARVDFGRFTPVLFTLLYYLLPLYGARTHLVIHAAACMNRALADAKFELGWDADPWSLALWTARDSAVPVLAVAAFLVVVDSGARRELVPSFVADPIRRWLRGGTVTRRREETKRRRR